jgi:methyltransferase
MSSAALVAFEVVVASAALQRLLELAHSRRNLARLSPAARAADSRGNWSSLVLLQAAWLGGCALEPLLHNGLPSASAFWSGLALFAAGAGLRTWCILALGPWWNARARVAPELEVVSHGPYRWIRHPNYLGVLLELVGLPLAGGAWWTLALLAPAHVWVLHRRMRGEDALLFALPGYAATMGTKGALWPRLGRR